MSRDLDNFGPALGWRRIELGLTRQQVVNMTNASLLALENLERGSIGPTAWPFGAVQEALDRYEQTLAATPPSTPPAPRPPAPSLSLDQYAILCRILRSAMAGSGIDSARSAYVLEGFTRRVDGWVGGSYIPPTP